MTIKLFTFNLSDNFITNKNPRRYERTNPYMGHIDSSALNKDKYIL